MRIICYTCRWQFHCNIKPPSGLPLSSPPLNKCLPNFCVPMVEINGGVFVPVVTEIRVLETEYWAFILMLNDDCWTSEVSKEIELTRNMGLLNFIMVSVNRVTIVIWNTAKITAYNKIFMCFASKLFRVLRGSFFLHFFILFFESFD